MTHTHTYRRWAMGTVALAASAANPEVEDYESERRSGSRSSGADQIPDGRLQ